MSKTEFILTEQMHSETDAELRTGDVNVSNNKLLEMQYDYKESFRIRLK
jgi:hypothetical protein